LFVWPSLRRSGAVAFIRGSLVRLGIPFAVGVVVLMPLAGYASWQLTEHPTDYLAYWGKDLAHERFPGPLWFIWVLLSFGILAASFYGVWPRRAAGLPVTWTRRRPAIAFAIMFWLCAFAYLPALKAFNWAWGAIGAPPFYIQLSRIGLYLLWFSVGVWLGSDDLERGLLAREGMLARRWIGYVAACVVAYNALWFVPKWLTSKHAVTPEKRDAIWAILWVASCVASCFGFLALFRGTVRTRRRWMDSLARSAYIIYIVHYVYVVWLQRALMTLHVHASLKFTAVFVGATLLSWLSALCLLAIPRFKEVL
jgi:hypothetical protein